MFLTGTMRVNRGGRLEIGGCDAVDLARRFGTPLYVLDEALVRQNCTAYRETLRRLYPRSQVAYAGKAFLNMAMCRLVGQEELALDVASGGEIYTALKAGFAPEKMIFHGNNKTPEEIRQALRAGLGRFVADSISELELLASLAAEERKIAAVVLRVKPGIEAHTHHYIQTGQLDSKFGLGLADGQALAAVCLALDAEYLEFCGLHCHIGSQIFELEPFRLAAAVMMDFIQEIRSKTGVVVRELNLGGGAGIRYLPEDTPFPVQRYLELITATLQEKASEHNLPLPLLLIEPGRSIAGEAGSTLYTAGAIKEIPGIRKIVAVDGGMTDNLRPALYGAKYTVLHAGRVEDRDLEVVTVAGKACESGDVLIRDAKLPSLARGDVLAVLSTGAYNYSMASNYNRFPRPAVVFVRDGHAELVVARESYEDLVRNDLLPELRTAAGGGSDRCGSQKCTA
ncbi:MAG: Diaminopimelate decarboxylase [Syntrophomonadaceae bacterium]|nr:Diaminopimelate decarboxylase [Bacillota bacterium]